MINNITKFYLVNVFIIILMIITPMTVLASVPTTTSFDRHNTYMLDGFRDGGYYAVRDNPLKAGYMNMSHVGGTNVFNITTYNIKNLTLDFDLMFERRSFLFGWATVTWEDAVDSLGDNITINIITDGKLTDMRFVDQPNVFVKVWKNGTVYRGWEHLSDVEIDSTGFTSGNHNVVIQFYDTITFNDLMNLLLWLIVIIGLLWLIYRMIRGVLFGDNGDYYMRVWDK